jgi:hypothetical protein
MAKCVFTFVIAIFLAMCPFIPSVSAQQGGDKITFALKVPGDVPSGIVNAEIINDDFIRTDGGFGLPENSVVYSTMRVGERVLVATSLMRGAGRIVSVGGENEPVPVPASGTVAVREGRRVCQGSIGRIDEFRLSQNRDRVRFIKSHDLPIGEVEGLALTGAGLVILWQDGGEQQFTIVPRREGKLDFSSTSAEPIRADHVVAITSDGVDLFILTNREMAQLAKIDFSSSGSFVVKEIWAINVNLVMDASITATESGAIYLANDRTLYRLNAEASEKIVEFPLHSHFSAISSR